MQRRPGTSAIERGSQTPTSASARDGALEPLRPPWMTRYSEVAGKSGGCARTGSDRVVGKVRLLRGSDIIYANYGRAARYGRHDCNVRFATLTD
jgi:hypothetical protein